MQHLKARPTRPIVRPKKRAFVTMRFDRNNQRATLHNHVDAEHKKGSHRKLGIILGSCLMVFPLAVTEMIAIGLNTTIDKKRELIDRNRAEYTNKDLTFVVANVVPEIAMIEYMTMSDRAARSLLPENAKQVSNSYLSAMVSQLSSVAMDLSEFNTPGEVEKFRKTLASVSEKAMVGAGAGQGIGELYGIIGEKIKERGHRLAALQLEEPELEEEVNTLSDRIDWMRRAATTLQIVGLVLVLWFEFVNMELLHVHHSEQRH